MTNIDDAQAFHGHVCPGLAAGVRVAEVVLRELGPSQDEEVHCTVESTSCEVDALQALVGCSLGKGNLHIKDHGKKVYTFLREDGKALRIAIRSRNVRPPVEYIMLSQKEERTPDEEERWKALKNDRVQRILTMDEEELLKIEAFKTHPPQRAVLGQTVLCDECGEGVMMAKAGVFENEVVCMPCFRGHKK